MKDETHTINGYCRRCRYIACKHTMRTAMHKDAQKLNAAMKRRENKTKTKQWNGSPIEQCSQTYKGVKTTMQTRRAELEQSLGMRYATRLLNYCIFRCVMKICAKRKRIITQSKRI